MKLLNILLLIFSCFISYNNLSAQSDIIARIGNTELTKDEFRLRYELSPRILSNNLDNTDSLKLKFLYSLVAEKLWAIEALDRGLVNSENYKFSLVMSTQTMQSKVKYFKTAEDTLFILIIVNKEE